jgi:curved DNA-binding protein CbpA
MKRACRYYEILGLSRDASHSDISNAYHSLLQTYHPDVSSHPRAPEKFREIHEAYAVLSDAEKKKAYDIALDTPGQNSEPEDDEIDFEHEFHVQNENFTTDGAHFVVNRVHHLIINGEEFLECDGILLPHKRENFPFDLHDIEDEYYTADETIPIGGAEYHFKNAHHIAIRGREYIEYDGDYIPFNRQEFPEHTDNNREMTHSGWNGGTLLIRLMIIFVVVFAVTNGILMMKSSANANYFSSQEKEWALQIRDAMDTQHPTTRDYALSLIDKSHAGERNIAQLCDIWEKNA